MKKILLIEDDFYIRGLYKKAFEKKDYQVIEAETGKVALEKAKDQDFDLVVLDLMLPDVSGMEILEDLKESLKVPIYVLTNVGDEGVLKEAREAGAKACFIKVDYTPKELVNAVEEKESFSGGDGSEEQEEEVEEEVFDDEGEPVED